MSLLRRIRLSLRSVRKNYRHKRLKPSPLWSQLR